MQLMSRRTSTAVRVSTCTCSIGVHVHLHSCLIHVPLHVYLLSKDFDGRVRVGHKREVSHAPCPGPYVLVQIFRRRNVLVVHIVPDGWSVC